jgi:hypothetical protein
MFDLDYRGAARSDKDHVDFIGLAMRIGVCEVREYVSDVVAVAAAELLIHSSKGPNLALIRERAAWHMDDAHL